MFMSLKQKLKAAKSKIRDFKGVKFKDIRQAFKKQNIMLEIAAMVIAAGTAFGVYETIHDYQRVKQAEVQLNVVAEKVGALKADEQFIDIVYGNIFTKEEKKKLAEFLEYYHDMIGADIGLGAPEVMEIIETTPLDRYKYYKELDLSVSANLNAAEVLKNLKPISYPASLSSESVKDIMEMSDAHEKSMNTIKATIIKMFSEIDGSEEIYKKIMKKRGSLSKVRDFVDNEVRSNF